MKTLIHPNGKSPNGHGPGLVKTLELDRTLATIRKRFGAGAVITADAPRLLTPVISTGFPSLDQALGIGGLPRGRIIDIYGPEDSGKTTLCLHQIAEAQKLGGRCLFIDTDHKLDRAYIAHCGVDVDSLYVCQPDCAEEGLEVADEIIDAGFAVVAIDSAAALVSRAELKGEAGDEIINYGSLMSQVMRKLAGKVRQHGTILVFTNQLRYNPNGLFVNEKITGGKALRHYASIQIRLQSLKNLKREGVVVGQRTRAVIKKNKLAAPFKEAEFDLITVAEAPSARVQAQESGQ